MRAIVLCSGGLDSVTCAYYVKRKLKAKDMMILFYDYGQRALLEERKCAKTCANKLKARFLEIKLPRINLISGDLVNNKRAKKIFRKDLKDTKKESEKWYVPQRNLIFLSYALSIAESLLIKNKKKYDIFIGFKNEGREHYPDATQEFLSIVNKIEKECKTGIEIKAPLIEEDKEEIIEMGEKFGVKFEETYSCYQGGRIQCGECLACRLRKEGFHWANINDKTKYKVN